MFDNSTYAHGVDVSHLQSSIHWQQALDAGVQFAICKASQGDTFTDPQFARNWQALGEVGLTRGAYHFFQPGVDGRSQAEYFLGVYGAHDPRALPPTLDLEQQGDMTPHEVRLAALLWLETVETATGVVPILYTFPAFASENALGTALARYHLWIANPGNARPEMPAGWGQYLLWQYGFGESAGGAIVPGITGGVDVDSAFTTHAGLIAHLGLG